MSKTWVGVIGTALVIVVIVWLLGTRINCYQSFWDKDKQVIEIKR